MKLNRRSLMGALSLMLIGAMGASADVYYLVDQNIPFSPFPYATATGFIDTDGKLGVIGAGDIWSWNIQLSVPGQFPHATLNTFNSSIYSSGNDLTATSTTLYFNYSAIDGGFFRIQVTAPFLEPSYYCDAAPFPPTGGTFGCQQGLSIVTGEGTPGSNPTGYLDIIDGVAGIPVEGDRPIASTLTATPEPGYVGMLAIFGGLGAFVRKRKSRSS